MTCFFRRSSKAGPGSLLAFLRRSAFFPLFPLYRRKTQVPEMDVEGLPSFFLDLTEGRERIRAEGGRETPLLLKKSEGNRTVWRGADFTLLLERVGERDEYFFATLLFSTRACLLVGRNN